MAKVPNPSGRPAHNPPPKPLVGGPKNAPFVPATKGSTPKPGKYGGTKRGTESGR